MRKFHLIDLDHGKASKKQDNLYMTASKIALKYGNFGRGFNNCDECYIQEFWEGDGCPSTEYFKKHVSVSTVKWYIHHKLDLSDKIWNGDFLHGVATTGNINWGIRRFPSLYWTVNDNVFRMINKSGFGGKLSHYKINKYSYGWCGVPALYLKHNESSTNFMAGVLASGVFHKKDGFTYVKYNSSHRKYLEKWSIPIEDEIMNGRYVLVSPIWGSVFSLKMPEEEKSKWLNIERPFGRNIYPPILWKTYVNNDFTKDGIPYLRSRRWIYNHYKSERGAMKTLEMERVVRNLTQLNKGIKDMVHEWIKEDKK